MLHLDSWHCCVFSYLTKGGNCVCVFPQSFAFLEGKWESLRTGVKGKRSPHLPTYLHLSHYYSLYDEFFDWLWNAFFLPIIIISISFWESLFIILRIHIMFRSLKPWGIDYWWLHITFFSFPDTFCQKHSRHSRHCTFLHYFYSFTFFNDKNYLKEIKFWKVWKLNSPLYIFEAIISLKILFSKFKVIIARTVECSAHTHFA